MNFVAVILDKKLTLRGKRGEVQTFAAEPCDLFLEEEQLCEAIINPHLLPSVAPATSGAAGSPFGAPPCRDPVPRVLNPHRRLDQSPNPKQTAWFGGFSILELGTRSLFGICSLPRRGKNGLTKSGHISINGVFLHFEFPETKHPHGTERRQQRRRLSFSESLLHKTSP